MTQVKFNHDVKHIHSSLGIEDQRADEITASVMFEIINQQFMIKDLYDDPEEAPRSMTTKTGVIEKIMSDTKNEAENLLAMWEFSKLETLIDVSEKHRNEIFMMITMMYMITNRKKDAFIKEFIKRKTQAEEED